jgi:hypothetical protein
MSTSAEILNAVEAAFSDVPKPEHFMKYSGDPESMEHDELLHERDRKTLKIEDVGNICWQPMSSCSPQGMGYYMPALARLALSEPTYGFGRYGDTLLIHLESRHDFFQFCNREQRAAVSSLLRHLGTLFPDCEWRLAEPEEFFECAHSWSKE